MRKFVVHPDEKCFAKRDRGADVPAVLDRRLERNVADFYVDIGFSYTSKFLQSVMTCSITARASTCGETK